MLAQNILRRAHSTGFGHMIQGLERRGHGPAFVGTLRGGPAAGVRGQAAVPVGARCGLGD